MILCSRFFSLSVVLFDIFVQTQIFIYPWKKQTFVHLKRHPILYIFSHNLAAMGGATAPMDPQRQLGSSREVPHATWYSALQFKIWFGFTLTKSGIKTTNAVKNREQSDIYTCIDWGNPL